MLFQYPKFVLFNIKKNPKIFPSTLIKIEIFHPIKLPPKKKTPKPEMGKRRSMHPHPPSNTCTYATAPGRGWPIQLVATPQLVGIINQLLRATATDPNFVLRRSSGVQQLPGLHWPRNLRFVAIRNGVSTGWHAHLDHFWCVVQRRLSRCRDVWLVQISIGVCALGSVRSGICLCQECAWANVKIKVLAYEMKCPSVGFNSWIKYVPRKRIWVWYFWILTTGATSLFEIVWKFVIVFSGIW